MRYEVEDGRLKRSLYLRSENPDLDIGSLERNPSCVDRERFAAEAKPVGAAVQAGLFGAGFALRLARAEARAAGGGLDVGEEAVTLTLPLLTGEGALPSPMEREDPGDAA